MKLLENIGSLVIPTDISKKFVLNGMAKVYKVYKIRIDSLYYNDQNDRIASWISQYRSEHGSESLKNLSFDDYNNIIEKFIISSNPQSIEKTQNNIQILGQREPAVVLNDGRIIDGNRRFTCIRRIHQNNASFQWLEAIILDLDIINDKKQIKILELSIQHGEDKKVDYNSLERLVGIYQDVVDSGLLTVEEYSKSVNEPLAETKKRVEAAKILAEYLEYIGSPKQFYIARDYPIISLISDMQELFKKCNSSQMIEQLKMIIFNNIFMRTIGDERKYIKNLSTIISNGYFDDFYNQQKEINDKIQERKSEQECNTLNDYKMFARNNSDIFDELNDSLDDILNQSKKTETKNKPAQIVSKSIKSLNEIDLNIVNSLSNIQKEIVLNQVKRLNKMMGKICEAAGGESDFVTFKKTSVENFNKIKFLKNKEISPTTSIQIHSANDISMLCLNMSIECKNIGDNYFMFFTDKKFNRISEEQKLIEGTINYLFNLNSKVSNEKSALLIIKNTNCAEDEACLVFEFNVNIAFNADFGF